MVIVSLNTDEFIEEYKGKPPIISYQDRAEVLLFCRYVDKRAQILWYLKVTFTNLQNQPKETPEIWLYCYVQIGTQTFEHTKCSSIQRSA